MDFNKHWAGAGGVILAIVVVAWLITSYVLVDRDGAIELMTRIQKGMRFSEVAKIIPLSESDVLPVVEYGGTWYDCPIGIKYVIQLRFQHPQKDQKIQDTIINYSPRLKNREGTVLISGAEEPW